MEETGRTVIRLVHRSHLGKVWRRALPHLKRAIEAGGNLLHIKYLARELLRGNMNLFLVITDRVVNGVAVTQVMSNAQGEYLHVLLAAVSSNLGTLNDLRDALEEVAQQYGMRGMTWSSLDERWGAWAKRSGYVPRFVEYVKEF